MSSISDLFFQSEPTRHRIENLPPSQRLLNVGPQHPATHGIMRLEVVLEGEIVIDVVPHIGYLHRCFEKHAELLPYAQIIPYVDRLDYLSAMNSEHGFVLGVEKLLGLTEKIPRRIEYIRVLTAELNRIASHCLAIGTYGIDLGASTAFLWFMRCREHIQRLLEWLCGARMLYNYMWIGGLHFDLPSGFISRCKELVAHMRQKLLEMRTLLLENPIFIVRTAGVGVLPLDTAISYGVSGPVLRASGLRFDLRKTDGYSIYAALDFEVPIGEGIVGEVGDCWDRTWVRFAEIGTSLQIINQCVDWISTETARQSRFDPRASVPKKVRIPTVKNLYTRSENPRGELGFFFRTGPPGTQPVRCKVRAPSFANLSVLPVITRGGSFSDLIATLGSLDIVLGEVDR